MTACIGKTPLIPCIVLLVSLTTGTNAGARDFPAQPESAANRSKDSHAIDELPIFDIQNGEAPTKTVEKAAQRQIEHSIDTDNEEVLAPSGAGKVMVTTEQKSDASKESTNIGRDNPDDNYQVPTDANVRRRTVALALGGGGARGAAHIGVLRVLKEANIPIDYIVGNSMGSIVGGLYAAGVPLAEIEKIMLDGSLRKAYLPGMIPPKLLISPLEKLMHPVRKHYAGLWTGKKFGRFLEKQLPTGIENVEDTPIPFSAVATNLIDGKAYRISDGRLSTAIRASSTIPPFLQPVAIGDRVYIDGGVRANLPASAARDTGADIVIAILVDEPLRSLPATTF
ncbi:MAG: patatin-like phospholipase family protein, partial [Cyanobacteria bacterium]|nr:patatin-like phospholipase family protein [Cyanobacteriota bacterium]